MQIKKGLIFAVAISALVSSATTIGAFALYNNNGTDIIKGSGGCPIADIQEAADRA